jgi:hypothetical protein
MIENIIVKHLAVNGHTEGIALRHLIAPGAAGWVCDQCGGSCIVANRMLFIDWDLNESLLCPPCYELEQYHKLQERKRRPYYHLVKEVARGYGVPFD